MITIAYFKVQVKYFILIKWSIERAELSINKL